MAKKAKRRCPTHGFDLEPRRTRYGTRWTCPFQGCSVVCWNGRTSTPADEETRKARQAAHAAFDPFWKGGCLSKAAAYKELAAYMGLTLKETHIGQFDQSQCAVVMAFCGQRITEPCQR